MFLVEPNQTRYDLVFQIFGFPVRVHPLFWLGCLILGSSGGSDGQGILLWTFVVFISILVHELGHAFMMRSFGRPARIILYLMGGLAVEGGGILDFQYRPRQRAPQEQILISFAGPAAGFVLAALVALVVVLTGGHILFVPSFPFFWDVVLTQGNPILGQLIDMFLYVNIFWGLVNLLPVLPLDGGHIAQQMLIVKDPWGGIVKSLWLGVITSAGVVLYAASQDSTFMLLMFLSLGASNYMALQQIGGGGFGRGRGW